MAGCNVPTCGKKPQWNVRAEALVLLEHAAVDVTSSDLALCERLAAVLTWIAILAFKGFAILALAEALFWAAIMSLHLCGSACHRGRAALAVPLWPVLSYTWSS